MFIDTIRRDNKKSLKKTPSQKKATQKKTHQRNSNVKNARGESSQKKRVPSKKTTAPSGKKRVYHSDASTRKVAAKNINSSKGKKSSRGSKKPRDNRQRMQPIVRNVSADKVSSNIKPIAKDTLRIIPVGGQEEVGRNMTIFEYGSDIVIVDMGMQFPEEDMPGIDYIVPNISYLRGKEKNIRGVIYTHGHLDHIGAAPILLEQLGYPPIIGRDLTLAMIKKKVEDYQPGSVNRLKSIRVKSFRDVIRLGKFEAGFFDVEHSIMDAIGVVLATPQGTILHLGDWTIGHDQIDEKKISYEHLSRLPKPTILMLESLGAINKKEPKSEKQVQKNLEDLIEAAPGRVIIGTFSSQVKRVSYLLNHAQRIGKKVVLDGYSMKMNVGIAKELGYLKIKEENLITVQDIAKYPDNKVVVICTGAQGETNAVLNRIVTDNHRFIKIQKNDTIVFSSSIIPGNERSIQRLKDNLYRKCDNVIHSDIMDIHMSGHSTAADMKEVIKQIKPTYFIPVYANHFFLKEAVKRAKEIGFPEKNSFVLDNGHVIEFGKNKVHTLKDKVDTSYVFIDGLGVGDIGHVVLRDRQMLAEDGMFAITAIIDSKSKEIVGNIQVTSRGFIYVKENFDLLNETKRKVAKIIRETTSKETKIDWKFVENNIRDVVGQYLFQKTQRRPMVLPVVLEV